MPLIQKLKQKEMRSTSVFCYGIKPAMKNLTVVLWLLAFINKREKQARCTDNRSKVQCL